MRTVTDGFSVQDELEQIYSEHGQALFSLALAITRNREQAEDAVHEAFARLCGSTQTRPRELVAYVFVCVRNAAVDEQRRHHNSKIPAASLFQFSDDSTARHRCETEQVSSTATGTSSGLMAVEQTESAELLAAAIDSLDQATREIIVLKTWAAMTFAAISQVTGVPTKTVETKYRRGLLKLNAILKEQL